MKIGDLKQAQQVWRQQANLRRALPAGPTPTTGAPDAETWWRRSHRPRFANASAGTVFFDVGRCVIDDFNQVTVLSNLTGIGTHGSPRPGQMPLTRQ